MTRREGPPLEVVHYDVAEGEGEDRQGRHAARPRAPHAHVQLPRVQGCVSPPSPSTVPGYLTVGRRRGGNRHEGRVPEIRIAVLRVRDQPERQRAHHAGDHPPLCRGARPVLWECEYCVRYLAGGRVADSLAQVCELDLYADISHGKRTQLTSDLVPTASSTSRRRTR